MEQYKKNLNSPDEIRKFDKGELALVNLNGITIGRAIFQPGWKWSECVKPIAQTESCEAPHTGFIISGRMKVQMKNGDSFELGPDDALSIPPGHDAWVVGNEPCVSLDFTGYENYAKPKE